MSFARVINHYLNLDAQGNPLVSGINNISPRSTPTYVQGDTVLVRIWPLTETGQATAPLATARLAAGSELVIAAKAAANLGATSLLFSALAFAERNTEVDNSGAWYYEAELELNTTDLNTAIAALSSTATSLALKVDIEIQNADNSERITYQFDAAAIRQVYAGEASPVPGTPVYPHPRTLMVRGVGKSVDVAEGATEVTVDYSSLSLDGLPTAILATFVSPNAPRTVISASVVAGWTATAATVILSAAAPAGARLSVLIVPGIYIGD